jgi:hypothetical protein
MTQYLDKLAAHINLAALALTLRLLPFLVALIFRATISLHEDEAPIEINVRSLQ